MFFNQRFKGIFSRVCLLSAFIFISSASANSDNMLMHQGATQSIAPLNNDTDANGNPLTISDGQGGTAIGTIYVTVIEGDSNPSPVPQPNFDENAIPHHHQHHKS